MHSSTFFRALQRYERDKQEKLADQRRRSSGDISMLGLGLSGSVASRGTLASRRFTMPFPKPGREDESDEVSIAIQYSTVQYPLFL